MQNARTNSIRRARRGFTITEAAAVAAAVAVIGAATVPVFRRVGCSAMRQQSMAQLATLASAHAEYAADFNGRQFTACPDDLGAFGGNFAAYQSANGCIPPMTLGTSASGQTTVIGYGTGSCPGTAGGGAFQIPLSFSGASVGQGSFRWTNVRQFNTYVGGRFYDQAFYAPDDPAMTRKVQRWIDQGRDFEQDAQSGIVNSTYDYSPAAMFHPRVFGDGTNLANPSYLNPPSVPNGEGYKSPSNTQCQYPSLKTRLLERHCMEPYLGMNGNIAGGQTPYQWNHSYRARSYAAFFDGSVRLFTTAEAMNAQERARVPGTQSPMRLWLQNTPFGPQGFGGGQSNDFLVRTSVHYLTANGIRGRDTLPPP
jgi:type II secretory pathway pseudopilin PulG